MRNTQIQIDFRKPTKKHPVIRSVMIVCRAGDLPKYWAKARELLEGIRK